MGFKIERFIHSNLVKEIASFFCSFCQNVMIDPMVASTCDHVFCRKCIEGLVIDEAGVCPVDGQDFEWDDIQENKTLGAKIEDLDVSCDYSSFGCNETLKLGLLSTHRKDCPFGPDVIIDCPEGCGASFKRKRKDSHSCAYHLLVIIKSNKLLVEKIVENNSRKGFELVKKLIEAESTINAKLKELLKLQSGDQVEPIVGDIEKRIEEKRDVSPVKADEVNESPVDAKVTLVKVKIEAETNPSDFKLNFERIKIEKEQASDEREVIMIDSDDDQRDDHQEYKVEDEPMEEDYEATLDWGESSDGSQATEPEESDVSGKRQAEDDPIDSLTSRGSGDTSDSPSVSSPKKVVSSVRSETITMTAPFYETRYVKRIEESFLSSDVSKEKEMQENDQIEVPSREAEKYTVKVLKLDCVLCQNTFDAYSHLMAHEPCYSASRGIKGKQFVPFVCNVCDKMCTSIKQLREHLAHHKDEDRFTCNSCGKGFCSLNLMKAHLHSHAGKIPFLNKLRRKYTQRGKMAAKSIARTDCEQETSNSKTKEDSQQRLSSKEVTKKVAKKSEQYVKKVLNDMGEKVVVLMKKMACRCSSCGKTFDRKSRSMIHLTCYVDKSGTSVNDGNGRPYGCEMCSKRFTHINYLRGHLATHVDMGMFKCIVCGKIFSTEHNLLKHIRSHSGHRPYKCGYCSKTFAHGFVRDDHQRIHTGEKPFQCRWTGCKKIFSSTASERTHFRRHLRKEGNLTTNLQSRVRGTQLKNKS